MVPIYSSYLICCYHSNCNYICVLYIYVVLAGFGCCVAGHMAFELLLELYIGLSIESFTRVLLM